MCGTRKQKCLCELYIHHVFGECRVSQLLLAVNIQFVSQRRADGGHTRGHGPARGHPSSRLRSHTILALTLSRCSVTDDMIVNIYSASWFVL